MIGLSVRSGEITLCTVYTTRPLHVSSALFYTCVPVHLLLYKLSLVERIRSLPKTSIMNWRGV